MYVCMHACLYVFMYTVWTHVCTESPNLQAEAALAPCDPQASLIDPEASQVAKASVPQ
jgi:hypothetical protein